MDDFIEKKVGYATMMILSIVIGLAICAVAGTVIGIIS